MFNDILSTDKQVAEMVQDMVEVCTFSGCSLMDLLYAMNEALTEDKRFFTTDSVIEMFNEHMNALAENEDVEQ